MSTTSRLLGTLVQAQLVERDESRRYVLGQRLVELGRRATQAQAVSSLQDVRPVRDDAVAVLGPELSDARRDLLRTLAGLGEERQVEQARWLTDAVAAEQAWIDCAKIITDSPGATVGLSPEPVVREPGSGTPVAGLADVTQQAESFARAHHGTGAAAGPRGALACRHPPLARPVSVLQCLQEIARSDRDLQAAVSGKSVARREVRPRAASASITHERRVLLHHVNLRGIVTTVATLIYLEEAEAELLRSLGLLGLAHRFSRIYFEIQHRRPSFYDDVVTIHLKVNRVGDTSVHYDFTVFNQGRVAAFGKWGLCLMDEDGQPTPIPPETRRVLIEARPVALTGQGGTP